MNFLFELECPRRDELRAYEQPARFQTRLRMLMFANRLLPLYLNQWTQQE